MCFQVSRNRWANYVNFKSLFARPFQSSVRQLGPEAVSPQRIRHFTVDELQYLARQRVFKIRNLAIAVDFNASAGGLLGRWFAAAKHNAISKPYVSSLDLAAMLSATTAGGQRCSLPLFPLPCTPPRLAAKIDFMIGRPSASEAAPYYFNYINRVSGSDIVPSLHAQLEEVLPLLRGIAEEQSLFRYAPEKWSIRRMWGHVNDTERVFVLRALWFARGHDSALPSFDQEIAAVSGKADEVPWARHVEEFREIRMATISFFRNLPEEAWMRAGAASGNPFTVRACAYIVAGHVAHHTAILREKYL
jgi:DinB superfamily